MPGFADAQADGRIGRMGCNAGKKCPQAFKGVGLQAGKKRIHAAIIRMDPGVAPGEGLAGLRTFNT